MKIPVAASIAVVVATSLAAATGSGGQVVDHGKVVEDPQLDYRKYHKEITAEQAADDSRQAAQVSAAQASAARDEAAFRASLAATAFSLNDGAAAHPDAAPTEAAPNNATPSGDTSAVTPPVEDAPKGLSAGVLIAIAAVVIAALIGIGLALSPKRRRRRSHRSDSDEKAVRLADFARKSDRDGTGD